MPNRLEYSPTITSLAYPIEPPNYTLNLINRKGWTLIYGKAGDHRYTETHCAWNLRFLIVTNYSTTIEERPFIKPFTSNLIAEYNNLKVFRIDGQHHPKRLVQITDTLYHYFCNLEGITKDVSTTLRRAVTLPERKYYRYYCSFGQAQHKA